MEKRASFVIPKKRKLDQPSDDAVEESLSECPSTIPEGYEIVDANEEETSEVTKEAQMRSPGKSWSEECWKQMTVEKVQLIRNRRLQYSFENYKRKNNIEQEQMEYRVVYNEEEIRSIASDGLGVDSDGIIGIGDPRQGVMLYSTPATAHSGRFLYSNIPITVVMFRTATSGKSFEVPMSTDRIPPSKNHTAHVTMNTEGASLKFHRYLLEHYLGGVFHYEYLPNMTDIYKYPSMILPYAVITYRLPDTATSTTSPQKLSKIHRPLLIFRSDEICAHTLVFNSKEIPAMVCLPSILTEVPYVLHETRSEPVAYSLNDLSLFPELEALRSPEYFGKILLMDSVKIADESLLTHYVLRFTSEHKYFVDLFRKGKYMLVWTSSPFTIFYIPSGDVSAEFGLPHIENHMHLIVQRSQIPYPEDVASKTSSLFCYEEEPAGFSQFWSAGQEYSNEIVEIDEFGSEVYEDDYDEEEADQRREEAIHQEEGEEKDELVTSANYEFISSPIDPNLKGCISLRYDDGRRKDKVVTFKTDLVNIHYFERNSVSPEYHEDASLSFDEKRKKEEKVDPESQQKTDELFKNALAANRVENAQSPLTIAQSPLSGSPGSSNAVSPGNRPTPSPENITFATKPAQNAFILPPTPPPPAFIWNLPPPPLPNFSVPPPPIPSLPLLPPHLQTTSSAPKPAFPTGVPPPISYVIPPPPRIASSAPKPSSPTGVPPPVLPSPGALIPPPPGNTTKNNPAPMGSIAPPALYVQPKLSTPYARPECLIPVIGLPQDPRTKPTIPLPDISKPPPNFPVAPPVLPTPLEEEEPGEESMDLEEEDSMMEVDEDNGTEECAGKISKSRDPSEDNDILMKCFTSDSSVSTSKPDEMTTAVEKFQDSVLNSIRDSPNIMKLLTKKNEEPSSSSAADSKAQDTDFRKLPINKLAFAITKSKPPTTITAPNVLNDSDQDEGVVEGSKVKKSDTPKDIDYRKTEPSTSRHSSRNSNDDNPLNDRLADISLPRGTPQSEQAMRLINNFQGKLRAINKDSESKVQNVNEHLAYVSILAQLTPTPQPSQQEAASLSNSLTALFPLLSNANLTAEGLGIPKTVSSEPSQKCSEQSNTSQLSSISDDDIIFDGEVKINNQPNGGKVIIPAKNVRKAADAPPGITSRYQQGNSSPLQNRQFSNPPNNWRTIIRNQDIRQESRDWVNKLIPFSDPSVIGMCIFLDPDWKFGSDNVSANELYSLMNEILQQNRVSKPITPRIRATIYIHSCLDKEIWKKRTTTLRDFHEKIDRLKNGAAQVIKTLPEHKCDRESNIDRVTAGLVNCISDIHNTIGGNEVIFLTHNFPEDSLAGRSYTERGIKVRNIRQVLQMIEDTLKT
ncbi:hypothetical protein L5515_012120 [Caenorhabditis briggsae]|uniref:TASOR PIN domain-containing protein n=1 Tax=Caenorhabditis briggsae TaxID=6238 RepID=A0AAE9EWC6_CAEBR|nr:hypothetical protein L5515_012120 [Caenorhabditis briggsae]